MLLMFAELFYNLLCLLALLFAYSIINQFLMYFSVEIMYVHLARERIVLQLPRTCVYLQIKH